MSLTLHEARARAALISDVSYDLHLDLTDREAFACRALVRFACSEPGASTFLELGRATEVLVDGRPASYADGRIALTGLAARNEVLVEARIPYVTDGDGMHTFTDPADGETYVSAYVGMDVAQRVFPCFDQNDLKAEVALSVTAPAGWTVLANGRATTQGPDWRFARTPPIPVAMFVVCAGPWHSVRWEHRGLPFGWHARRSMAAALDRDAAQLRRVTEQCFDHYAEIFEEPYAYDSYDQVMVPGQNWGALETPGCVTYRDELLPVGTPSEGEVRRRTTIIAHEMAHMWFGNLVTMTWWEDTWLQESFADHMGYRVSQAAAGNAGAFADFLVQRAPGAYAADQRRSTHPVAALADEVPDVDTAAGNFDAISYAKGNACIQQLVTWLGYVPFLAGVNAYLHRHRFGNATLEDFVAALDSVTDRDVHGWVQAWLRTTGFDTIRVTRDADGVRVHRDGTRHHRLGVTSLDADLRVLDSGLVDLGDEPVLLPPAAVVVPNSGGETYARLHFDPESWRVLSARLSDVADHTTRAVVWSSAFDRVGSGDLSPDEFLGLLGANLPGESSVAIVDSVVAWTTTVLVPRHLEPADVPAAMAVLARACEEGLAAGTDPEVAVSLTRGLASVTTDADLLHAWLRDGLTADGVEVEPQLRWAAWWRLARLGAADETQIAQEREQDATVVGSLGAARALAARPTAEAKAEAWAVMFEDADVSNRMLTWVAQGFWDPEHADLVRPYVARYAAAAPEVALARGQAFAMLLARAFPAIHLDPAELRMFVDALEEGVPTVLRRGWSDALDDRMAT